MELIKGSAKALLIKLFAAALSFVVAASITRTVGQEVAGLYFFGTAIVAVLVSFGSLGLNNAVLKHVAIYYNQNNLLALNAIVNKSILWAMFASVLVVILVMVGLQHLGPKELDVYASLEPFIFSIPGLVTVALLAHAIQGTNKVVSSMLLGGIIQPLVFFALILAIEPQTTFDLATCYTASALLTTAITVIYWVTSVKFTFSMDFPSEPLRKSSFSLLVFQVFQQFNLVIGLVILGVWGTAEEVAVFSVALKIASITSIIMFAVNRVAAPKFAALHSEGDTVGLSLAVKHSKRIMLLGSLPILIIFLSLPEFVLGLFGSDYKSGAIILRLLAFVQLLSVWVGSVSYLLIMTGEEKTHRNNVILATLVSCSIGIAVVQSNAMMGAVLVSALCVLIVSLLSGLAVYRKLNINILKF
jgi:O-antigen/teichoic acid export membrane protein